jgi:predicted GNAT family acetyltransferase
MELFNNTERGAFEMPVQEGTAFISYRTTGDVVSLMHTEVPQELEGQGIGATLVEQTFQYLEANNMKIVPRCSFVITYLKRHPEWNKLVDESAAA